VLGSEHDPLLARSALRSGERFKLWLRASAPGHGLIAYCDSSNQLQLYPASGTIPLAAREEVVVPGTFELDVNEGCENLFVIASREAIDQSDPQLARALQDAARGGVPCPKQLRQSTLESVHEPAHTVARPSPPPVPRRMDAAVPHDASAGAKSAADAGASTGALRADAGPATDDAQVPLVPRHHFVRGIKHQSDAAEASLEGDAYGIALFAFAFAHVSESGAIDSTQSAQGRCSRP